MMKKYILRGLALAMAVLLMMTSSGLALTLRYSQKGEAVAQLQTALKQLGYYTKRIDGDYGSGTRTAVRSFQKAYGLTVDGVAGPATLGRIQQLTGITVGGATTDAPEETPEEEETPATGSGLFGGDYATLKVGSKGERVRILQRALKALGFELGVDGSFGTATKTVVKAFQKAQSLTADGVAGKNTLKKLETFFDEDGNLISDPIVPQPDAEEEDSDTGDDTGSDTVIPSRTLRYGMTGDDVKAVQTRLIELGYLSGSATGSYASVTQAAVKAFQTANDLTADGIAGAKTYAVLFSEGALPAQGDKDETTDSGSGDSGSEETDTPSSPETGYDVPDRTLRYGMSGDDVKVLQNRLIELGYLKITADGDFCAATLAAVKAFQQNNGLTVDGVAGNATYSRLFSDAAAEAPADTTVIPERSLSAGDEGDDVKSVQQRLKDLGYLSSAVDGQYGTDTTAAMKAFQQMNGLTVTGSGNASTYARLYSDDALTAEGICLGESVPAYTNLKSGATGTTVIRLQQALAALDYDVSVTGTYDDATLQAVRSFQVINRLSVDGVAGKNTQKLLYSGTAKAFPVGPDGAIYGSMGYVAAPNKSEIKLLHWADELKDTLAYHDALLAYDPATGISWSLTIIARGRHCDVEPSTKADTAAMMAAFGNKAYWTPVKPVYVRLPDGRWTVATTHNVAHGVNPIKDNDFEGQNCVHFLRDMSETEQKDPDYGVTNQKALREFWKSLTGETIPYK